MNNHFKCPHCDKHHKNGHPKTGANQDKFRNQRDQLRRENNILKRELNSSKMSDPFAGSILKYGWHNVQSEKKVSEVTTQSTELMVGYRVWSYAEGYLRSTFKTNFAWPHRKPLTKDIYDDAGIHACKEYKKVLPLLSEYCDGMVSKIGVAGSVYLWGEVKEHETGYLAEFAYPKEFFVGDDMDPLLAMQLEEDYGVSVTFRAELSKDLWPKHRAPDWLQQFWHPVRYTFSIAPWPWNLPSGRDDIINDQTPAVKKDALAKDDPTFRQPVYYSKGIVDALMRLRS